MNCMRCGGKGKPEGCPTCGKKIVMPEIKQEFLSNSKIIDWDTDRLNKDNPNLVAIIVLHPCATLANGPP